LYSGYCMSKVAKRNRTSTKPPTKKEQILSLYMAGARNVSELAALTQSRPSYVASVLHKAKALRSYFDLYTTTDEPMNIYSNLFAKRLGFRTEAIARRSITYIDRMYRHFAQMGDRAGQHHALVMALTMFNRARWSKKLREAQIFQEWLLHRLTAIIVPTTLPAHHHVPAREQQKTPIGRHIPVRRLVRRSFSEGGAT
jgi:hypothetical protein